MEDIKSRLKLGSACYHTEQYLFVSQAAIQNLKNMIYKTVILPAILYGCERKGS